MTAPVDVEDALARYAKAERQLHELFGYRPQWRVFPVDDQTGAWWMDLSEARGGRIAWALRPFDEELVVEGKAHFSGEIYTYRHLDRWVFRTETHTMALVDTRCDLNVLLMVFDNSRECVDEALKELYRRHW